MKKAILSKVVGYADRLLATGEFEDWAGAVNGLQVQNSGKVTLIAAMVDATPVTVGKAIAAGADLMVVHHGLFWGPSHPWTGARYELLRNLLENDLAVYSSHLPLDAHPRLGNNILLARALGITRPTPFFESKGRLIGYRGQLEVDRATLQQRLGAVLGGRVHLLPGGPTRCRNVGVVTGGAGAELHVAAAEGIDTFITGEGPHWTFGRAEELGLNVFYGGHYATETFGVKALAAHLAKRFGVAWTFIDHPTGL